MSYKALAVHLWNLINHEESHRNFIFLHRYSHSLKASDCDDGFTPEQRDHVIKGHRP